MTGPVGIINPGFENMLVHTLRFSPTVLTLRLGGRIIGLQPAYQPHRSLSTKLAYNTGAIIGLDMARAVDSCHEKNDDVKG